MTNKQQLFVGEYLLDFNATQAAIRAGYSEKTAEAIGFENLKKPKIEKAIADALKERRQRYDITEERVLEEIGVMAFAPMPDGFKPADKLAALDKLCKYLGMFTEHVHHSGDITTTVRAMSDEELLERHTDYANRFKNLEAVRPDPALLNGDVNGDGE